MQDVYANYSQKHRTHCMSKTEPVKKRSYFFLGKIKAKYKIQPFHYFLFPYPYANMLTNLILLIS